jgi:regulatory protein
LALGWLARREHSQHELQTKLINRGCTETLAERTVQALTAENLVSDERFTESLLRVRRSRGYGPLRIRHELREKGVPIPLIEKFLNAQEHSWVEDLKRVRCKKFGETRPKNYAERAKQARFLQYRGFTSDQIQRVMDPREPD